jgi:hypothetical protein
VPRGIDALRVPTDLTDVTPGSYDPKRRDKNFQATLGPFCNQLRRALRKREALRPRRAPASRQEREMGARCVTIHSALYGVAGSWLDVKIPLVKALKRDGVAQASNKLAGDPQCGVVKTLRLDFSYRGERRQVEIPEGGFVTFQ